MHENGMPVKKLCANCEQTDCSADKQSNFEHLQVASTEGHDQMLVDTRMLGVFSSNESRKTTSKTSAMSMRPHSDYWLKRFMASVDKVGSFLQRRLPRAQTHEQLHDPSHVLASSLQPLSPRSSSY